MTQTHAQTQPLRAQLAALPTRAAKLADLPRDAAGYYFRRSLYGDYTRTLLNGALVGLYHYERATSWRRHLDDEEAAAAGRAALAPGDWLDARASLSLSERRRRARHPSAQLLDVFKTPDLLASPYRTGGELDEAARLLEEAFIALALPGYTPSAYEPVGADGYGDRLRGDAGEHTRSPGVLYAESFTPALDAAPLADVPFVCLSALLLVAQSLAAYESRRLNLARRAIGGAYQIHAIDFLRGEEWRAAAAIVGLVSSAAREPSDRLGYVTIPRVVRGSRPCLTTWVEEEGGRLTMTLPSGGRLKADRDGTWQRCDLPGWGGSEVGGARDRASAQRAAQLAYFNHFDAWRLATGRIVER